ncbi:hypothetical protein HML84_01840 [Alcanivorax sp. IO_7]|nr:hypothetical protein HML84_01840 [Alcanivorax sp. IO_7]
MVCLVSGLGLFYVQHQVLAPASPGQVLHGAKDATASAFVRSPEAALLMVQGDGQPLSGRLHGQGLDGPGSP